MKVCLDCPTLIPTGNRCPQHRRAKDHERGTSTARGYDATHRALRAGYATRMAAGETFTCWRCGDPIDPTAWDLGHDDHDRSIYRGPECIPCNRATTGRDISHTPAVPAPAPAPADPATVDTAPEQPTP